MQPIETMKWGSIKKEYRRQKRVVSDKICLHLKGYQPRRIIDNENDTIEEYDICNQCGRVLDAIDKIQIVINLRKFKQKI